MGRPTVVGVATPCDPLTGTRRICLDLPETVEAEPERFFRHVAQKTVIKQLHPGGASDA